jgi:ABC-type siderophore export system fused ATPase/permease subunit
MFNRSWFEVSMEDISKVRRFCIKIFYLFLFLTVFYMIFLPILDVSSAVYLIILTVNVIGMCIITYAIYYLDLVVFLRNMVVYLEKIREECGKDGKDGKYKRFF